MLINQCHVERRQHGPLVMIHFDAYSGTYKQSIRFDHGGITSLATATLGLEFLYVLAASKHA